MYITELGAHGGSSCADGVVDSSSNHHRRRRGSTSSSSSTTPITDEAAFATSLLQPKDKTHRTHLRMGSTSTITGAAGPTPTPASGQPVANWPGGIMRQTDIRVESRELETEAELEAELRRRPARSLRLPRDSSRWVSASDYQSLRDLAAFLRNVTPPPTNFMSQPEPVSPTTLSSSASSLRRQKQQKKKRGPLKRCLGLFRRSSSKKKKKLLSKKRSTSPSPRPPSPAARPPSRKKKRPPRLRLPDTAIAGTTVDGHRHIAISIPIEHAHLGPEPPYSFPAERRTRSLSSAETSPRIYSDVNVRPMTAFVSESHIGTQLGPLVEEHESVSSRSWEKTSQSGHEEARKVKLVSRHTFGTVQEESSRSNTSGSRPNTSAGGGGGGSQLARPKTPRASTDSHHSSASPPPPVTPRTSEELHQLSAHRQQTLAALTSSSSKSSHQQRPVSVGSAHSFRSFATPSPQSRICFPLRKSSLQPRPRSDSYGRGIQMHPNRHSRDSSRDQYTLQEESIFSEPSYLASVDTMASSGGGGEPSSTVVVLRDAAPVSSRRAGANNNNTEVVVREMRRPSLDGLGGEGSGAEDDEKEGDKADGGGGSDGPGHRDSAATVLFKPTRSSNNNNNNDNDGDEALGSPNSIVRRREMRSQLVEGSMDSPARSGKGKGKEEEEEEETEVQEMGGPSGQTDPDQVPMIVVGGYNKPDDTACAQKTEAADEPMTEASRTSSPASSKRKWIERGGSPIRTSRERRLSRSSQDGTRGAKLPSPTQRRERRRSTILSRKQKVAELRRALAKPGSQPSDLVWERRSSTSSDGSDGSSYATATSKRKTLTQDAMMPAATPLLSPARPKTAPGHLSFTPVLTVADVHPEDPQQQQQQQQQCIARTDSTPLSISSPTTVATVVKTSPIPPPFHQAVVDRVTPPDSPPPSPRSSSSSSAPPPLPSPTTPLRYPPALKRLNPSSSGSLRRRPSRGRASLSPQQLLSYGSSLDRDSPSPVPRPRTAGKGMLPSTKKTGFFGGGGTGSFGVAVTDAGSSAGDAGPGKSVLKMSRSEIFERYEALRERQTRDMEVRLRRLERNGDYWLTSMLPLLTDLSQTLGKLALDNDRGNKGKGKGKEVERATGLSAAAAAAHRTSGGHNSNNNGRKSRFGVRRHDELEDIDDDDDDDDDDDEPFSRRGGSPRYDDRSARPLWLHENAHLDNNDDDPDVGSYRRRRPPPRRAYTTTTTTLPPDGQSGTTTVVDSLGRLNSLTQQQQVMAKQRLQEEEEDEEERLWRMERLNERIDARMKGISIETLRRERAMRRNDDDDSDDEEDKYWGGGGGGVRGMDTITPLMRELQMSGSRLSLESDDFNDDGDSEVRRLREGPSPRAVVGFGAFSM